MNWISKLRPPKNATAADLRQKQAESEAQVAALRALVAEMERQRGPLLLDGSAAEVKAAEAALAAARDELAAATAMAATLAERAQAAERDEALAGFRASVAEATAEAERIAAWLRNRYPALADELAQVAIQEQELKDRISSMVHDRQHLAEQHPEAIEIVLPVEPHTAVGGIYSFAQILRLPGYANGPKGYQAGGLL